MFKKSEVAAQLTVGWYTEPVQRLYAADGRSKVFKKSEVAAQLTVGWYKSPKEAEILSEFSKHNIKVFFLEFKENSVDGIEPEIHWKNDSGKTIKYIYFTVIPYNAVGDIVSCDVSGRTSATLKATGPYEKFSKYDIGWFPYIYYDGRGYKVSKDYKTYQYYTDSSSWCLGRGLPDSFKFYLTDKDYDFVFNIESSWDAVLYNSSVAYLKLSNIQVEYMDGTFETINNPPIWSKVLKNAGL